MADNKQETIADIVAELLAAVDANERTGDYSMATDTVRVYADRIEAAAKRKHLETEASALAAGGFVEASRNKPGNAAAMREALEKIYDAFRIETSERARIMRKWTGDALSAPPRNCDRFATVRAARDEWWKMEVLPIVHGVAVGKVNGHEPAFDDWLFMSAKEGENDGSK